MRTRVLGSSGIEVSQLALGTMMFGAWGNPDRAECRKMVEIALDAGITLFDTADIYDFGVSEAMLGEALHGRREQRGGGHQVRQRDGRRSPPSRRIAPMGARGGHRQLAPARHRPHRPVPDAPTRPRHPVRGDARRARPTRPRRAGRCRRHVDLSRRATRRGAVGRQRGWTWYGPPPSNRRTRSCAAASSAPCSPCAAATTWVHSCGRHSTAVG